VLSSYGKCKYKEGVISLPDWFYMIGVARLVGYVMHVRYECALCAHGVETFDHLPTGCVFSR
jgi:hypothetical protein